MRNIASGRVSRRPRRCRSDAGHAAPPAPKSRAAAARASSVPPMADGTREPGWYADPSGRHDLRWWDGGRWTDRVAPRGGESVDPYDDKGGADVDAQPM